MKFKREEDFDPATFPWSMDAAKTVEKIVRAGRMDKLKELLESRFGGSSPYAEQIDTLLRQHSREILDICGLDKDGQIKKTKRFEVFFRIRGVVSEDVEAESPEKAAKAAHTLLMHDGDPLICIDRESLDELKPVAYNDEDGNTKDYPEDFEVEDEW